MRRQVKIAVTVLVTMVISMPALGATDVVLFYGWGPDGWSSGNFGLGAYQTEGPPAHYTVNIQRDHYHGAADTDVMYQRDAVYAVGAVADPSRRHLLERHLIRTAPHVDRQDAFVIWRRE